MKIGIDVMGGDFAPKESIAGAILAFEKLPSDDTLVLIGNREIILETLNKTGLNPDNFEIVHSSEQIEMGEHPTKAFSKKPNSSIAIGFKLLKTKKIDAFSSAGNTGAILVGSIYMINSIPGIIRPCIASLVPKENGGNNIILDVGINPDTKPDVMYQFGILGSLYAKSVLKINNPRVGLLNIGEEDEKGNLLCQSSFRLMKGALDFNYIGNIESGDIFNDNVDVIVCDGFTGNIILKLTESIYNIIKKRGLEDDYFKRYNYENYGGTPILGINSTVIIGHGKSNAIAFKNMILSSKNVFEAKLPQEIKLALDRCPQKLKV